MATVCIESCPICGSPRIRQVRRNIKRTVNGQSYTVPGVILHACPDCGEKFYDQAATDKIQNYSPAFKSVPAKKVRRAG